MPNTISINLHLDNAAFGPSRLSEAFEVSRILRKLADDFEINGIDFVEALRDANGNKVGAVLVQSDKL